MIVERELRVQALGCKDIEVSEYYIQYRASLSGNNLKFSKTPAGVREKLSSQKIGIIPWFSFCCCPNITKGGFPPVA